jgi:hypothetical protein
MQRDARRGWAGTLCLAAMATALLAGSARADDWVDIEQWGFLITEPGNYRLARDLEIGGNPLSTPAVTMSDVKGVKLRLNGKTITGQPNETHQGRGRAIALINCEDVVIEGVGAKIQRCQFAVTLSNAKNVTLTGDGLAVRNCEQGLLALKAEKVRVTGVTFGGNHACDLNLDNVNSSTISQCSLSGGAGIGVKLFSSEDVDIEQTAIGGDAKVARAIMIYNSARTDIVACRIGRADIAVTLQGGDTKQTLIKQCRFGEPEENTCDLRVSLGAEEPTLEDNRPDQLKRCD